MERKKPQSGEIYTHFKGRQYKVLNVAIHTETGEELVIYEAMYGSRGIYARPLAMFLSPVDREKYPDAGQRYRFELAGRDEGQKAASETEGEGKKAELSLIMQFLDCRSNEEKLRFLYQHRTEVKESFLTTAAESLGSVLTEKTTELRYEELMSYLRMKIKYETGRLR